MDQFKVFVSSTYKDLWDFRLAAIDQLVRMEQTPLAMEHFGSYPQDPTTVCAGKVEDCDVFVGIYAFRYGYTPGGCGPSITEQEYDLARHLGKRCLCYLAVESLRPPTSEEPDWKQQRLATFKERIDKELVRSTFNSPLDLARQLATDMARLLHGEPLGYALRDAVQRWSLWETEVRARIVSEDLDNRPNLVTSPLMYPWMEFMRCGRWHEQLADLLTDILDRASHFSALAPLARRVERINYADNYRTIVVNVEGFFSGNFVSDVSHIVAGLEEETGISGPIPHGRSEERGVELLRHARQLRQKLIDLQKHINSPFRRCFLIVGGLGTGKTHFIASLLQDSSPHPENEMKKFLYLPLKPPYANETLAELILRGVRDATRMGWRSLREFNGFLEAHQDKVRLVVVLDDLQKWLSAKPRFKEELIEFIASHSSLHSFYWLITLRETSYEEIADKCRFWQTYSQFERSTDVSPSIEDRRIRVSPSSTHVFSQSLANIGGWIVLDELNEFEGIGLRLLRSILRSESAVPSLALDQLDQCEATISQLSNPFLAWILLDLRDHFPLEALVNLNFIEFVDRFWTRRRSTIDRGPLTPTQLDQSVGLVARFLTDSGDFSPVLTKLLDAIANEAKGISELQDREKANLAVTVLEHANLLKRIAVASQDFRGYDVERIEIRFEPFWEWHLAKQLRQCNGIQKAHSQAAREELETWFGSVSSEQIKEGVLEFLLLLLDRDETTRCIDSHFIESIWHLGLNSKALPTPAVWFAAPKASERVQRLLTVVAPTHGFYLGERRSLFAFMYFLCGVSPSVLDVPTRLRLLQPHYGAIQRASLSPYYLFMVERLFARIEDNSVLFACMPYLSGCEIAGVAPELARLTIDTLARNYDYDVHRMLEFVIRYLQSSCEQAKAEYNARGRVSEWRRYFYREWVLQDMCGNFVADQELKAYHLLEERMWYRPWDVGIHGPVSIEMEREANIAIGYWYRTTWDEGLRKRFLELLDELVFEGDLRDREIAFHIIRHTEPTAGQKGVRVDPIFEPYLSNIFLDRRLKGTVDRFHEFFKVNLRHMGRSEE